MHLTHDSLSPPCAASACAARPRLATAACRVGIALLIAVSSIVLLLLLLLLPSADARAAGADKRIALVIGNARYPALPLNNPENDARVIAATLRRLGFEVIEHVNLPTKDFRKVVREYARRVHAEEGTSLFYYAGHGVQIEGRNYLLPVDVNLRDEDEVRDEGVDIDELLVSRLERARTQTRLVILDACRDNPFQAKTKTRNLRGAGGLAEMAARGALIAYATAPGASAEDGPAGTNSVFTRHLAREMLVEGIEVEQMFKNVRVKVMRDTGQRQIPWVNTSLTSNFAFNPRANGAEAERGADGARRDDLARLQALLDQRERAQKELEDKVRALSGELRRAQQGGGGAAAAAAAAGGRDSAGDTARAESASRPPDEAVAMPPATVAAPAPTLGTATATSKAPPPMSGGATGPSAAATVPAAASPARVDDGAPQPRPASALAPAATAPPTPATARLPMQPGAAAPTHTAAAAGPTAGAAAARPPGRAAASERCVALLVRASLGEPMSAADQSHLQKECR